jgi:acetyltransferase-like isoleucine patch superfamily enzyme
MRANFVSGKDRMIIGKDCVIGAGALVNKSIPDRSVAVGVPARVIRTRD